MVMSVCFNNLSIFGLFLCPTLCEIEKTQSVHKELSKPDHHQYLQQIYLIIIDLFPSLPVPLSANGNHSLPSLPGFRMWTLVLADQHTCEESFREKDTLIKYEIKLLNPDSLGIPANHFSCDEFGK
jgi:hypothetical protein